MPRVKLGSDAPLNEAAKRFYGFFRAGKNKAQICKLMGYSAGTDVSRTHNPEFFTLRELRILFNGVIKFITGIFSGNWKKAWEGIKDIFRGVFEGLSDRYYRYCKCHMGQYRVGSSRKIRD